MRRRCERTEGLRSSSWVSETAQLASSPGVRIVLLVPAPEHTGRWAARTRGGGGLAAPFHGPIAKMGQRRVLWWLLALRESTTPPQRY
jgi:hypothetical protein